MRRAAHLPAGRRLSKLGLIALLSCSLAVVACDSVATAAARPSTTARSLTRAQKLSKALKVCGRLPKRQRPACVKRAKRKYATHHSSVPTTPAAPAAPTVPPAMPPVTPPAAGPTAPAGPTLTQIQQWVCEHHCAYGQILNVSILERGVPRLGTGVSEQSGGDNVPRDTWIFPLLVGYDEVVQIGHYAPCPPEEPFCTPVWVTEPVTHHWTEKENAQLAAGGAWAIYFVSSSES